MKHPPSSLHWTKTKTLVNKRRKKKGDLVAKDKKFPQRITLLITTNITKYLFSITKYPYIQEEEDQVSSRIKPKKFHTTAIWTWVLK